MAQAWRLTCIVSLQSLAQRLRNLSQNSPVDLSFPSAFGCKTVVYSCMRHHPFLSTHINTYPSLPFNTPGYSNTRMELNTSGEQKVDIYRERKGKALSADHSYNSIMTGSGSS